MGVAPGAGAWIETSNNILPAPANSEADDWAGSSRDHQPFFLFCFIKNSTAILCFKMHHRLLRVRANDCAAF